MDLNRIFMKNATPTKIGGQAIMEGIMMRGEDRTATIVRLPDASLHLKTEKLKTPGRAAKLPLIRGCVSFFASLVMGTRILMYSADVLESFEYPEGEGPDDDKVTKWMNTHFGEKAAWNIMIYSSVVVAMLFTVGVFILLPTFLMNLAGNYIGNPVVLNLIEGLVRMLLFIGYIWAIRHMEEIREVFRYHGAEHKTIHCYENKLELTPENADSFYTLHPRCGTSFLMFVMVLTIFIYALLGWPSLFWRIVSRILLLPVIAGFSYELLRWAGSSDSAVVKGISLPGICLQKLTTCEPSAKHLEVAIAAMKACNVSPETPEYEGPCDLAGNPCTHEESIASAMTGAMGKATGNERTAPVAESL